MKKYFVVFMIVCLFCCSAGSCGKSDNETSQTDVSEVTSDTISSSSSQPSDNTEKPEETEPAVTQESLIVTEPHGNRIFKQLVDCSSDIPLSNNELFEAVSDSRIATVEYLYTGERDEFQEPIISGVIIRIRDLSGTVIKEMPFDNSICPQIVFDQHENLHVFFPAEGLTKHYVYSSDGTTLDERSFDLDHYVNVKGEVAFDDLDRMYVIKTEYSDRILANVHMLTLYSAEGELICSENIGSDEKIASIDGVVYLHRKRDQQVGLKAAIDVLSDVRAETQWIDIGAYADIYSAEGGMCYVKVDGDTLNETVWTYDIYSGDMHDLIQDMGNKYFIRMSCSSSRICLVVTGTDGELYSYLYRETE